MPLDVELSTLSAGGVTEPRADWSEQANKLLLDALKTEEQAKNIHMIPYQEDAKDSAGYQDLANQLIKLHGVVGNSIIMHEYVPQAALPSKNGAFDWSLGPAAKAIKEKYKADYAMFVWVRDSYADGGRVAVILVAAALGVGIQGGQQIGFASLVDLETGKVVWFNLLARGYGDLRNADGAANAAQNLLANLPQ
ncbi:hypothetical protein [Ferrovibrio xuzhouensis]|uniref:Uncharacterized protein n=1 Tax=Ferrovibrio xuzhouensis TaxID=1576914 RepID=A0ABV7VAW3_9PROT